MVILLHWANTSPGFFWTIAVIVTVIWMLATLMDRNGRWWALTSILLLVAWRWPYLFGPATLNPDEAQVISGAITLKSFPVYWKYVDGTTHGPLTNLPLLLAHFLGLPLNYATARLLSGIMMVGGFVLAARGLALLLPFSAVRLGFAAVILLWSSISYYDFSGYTSEQPALFIILASTWPLLAGLKRTGLSRVQRSWRLAVGASMLGAVPLAKLQAAPIAGMFGLLVIIAVASDQKYSRDEKLGLWSSLIAGALLPSVLTAGYLWIWGLGHQFWTAYIASNIMYAQMAPYSWGQMIGDFWSFLDAAPGLKSTVLLTISACLAALATATLKLRRRWAWVIYGPRRLQPVDELRFQCPKEAIRMGAVFGAVTLICLYATLAPRRPAGHYLQFMGLPLALGGALASAQLTRHFRRHTLLWRGAAASGAILILSGMLIGIRVNRSDPGMLDRWSKSDGEWRYPASRMIAQLARPGDTLAVWGWMPFFNVETGLPQGTREAHTQRQIEVSALRPFYRQRYLHDFARSRPRIFVDAVGGHNFGYSVDQPYWRESTHESFPELRKIIERDYELVADVESSRIYLRKSPQAQ